MRKNKQEKANPYILKEDDQGRVHLHFQTDLYVDVDDPNFFSRLEQMNCLIIKTYNDERVLVELPARWVEQRLSKLLSRIYDEYGRLRMIIYRDRRYVQWCRRFQNEAILTQDMNGRILGAAIRLWDGKALMDEYPIDASFIIEVLEMNDHDMDHIYHNLMVLSERLLFEQFPEWRDEMAYW